MPRGWIILERQTGEVGCGEEEAKDRGPQTAGPAEPDPCSVRTWASRGGAAASRASGGGLSPVDGREGGSSCGREAGPAGSEPGPRSRSCRGACSSPGRTRWSPPAWHLGAGPLPPETCPMRRSSSPEEESSAWLRSHSSKLRCVDCFRS